MMLEPFFIFGVACLQQYIIPLMLTLNTLFHCSLVMSFIVPWLSIPALLYNTSIRPHLFITSLIIALTLDSSLTSSLTNIACPFIFLIFETIACPLFSRLPVTTTLAPCSANR